MEEDRESMDLLMSMITVLGLILIGVMLMFLIRIQRGLLGFLLSTLAALLLFYWLREFKRTVKEELKRKTAVETDWVYDIVDHGKELLIVAEVPGPKEKVKVKLAHKTLKIFGGQGFKKTVKLSKDAEIKEAIYRNNVLQVKLIKK